MIEGAPQLAQQHQAVRVVGVALGRRLEDLARHLLREARVAARDEDAELVATQPGRPLAVAQHVAQPLPDFLQHQVAVKINKTPSYQLTAVGAPMPMLHVAKEIDEAALIAGARMEPGQVAPVCSFRISGGARGAKVSWRVEAVRNDLWVRTRGAPVEVEKQGLEKGTYQHPELYGQPPEKGMNYEAARERPKPARE